MKHTPTAQSNRNQLSKTWMRLDEKGLYCVPADTYIDPWRPVEKAVITHAHADHARAGSQHYWAHPATLSFMEQRKQLVEVKEAPPVCHAHGYGEVFELGGGVECSLHSAGHMLGSAQVRLSYRGEVWVVSGDYKRAPDPSCAPFEDVRCDVFISEATFGLPIYRWPRPESIVEALLEWWQSNAASERTSLVYAYSLGKAQRVLAHLAQCSEGRRPGSVVVHPAVAKMMPTYERAGISFPPWLVVDQAEDLAQRERASALYLGPPTAFKGRWLKTAQRPDHAFVSGWMQLRGQRRRRGYQKGFVMSDHADWLELLQTIRACQAEQVFLTHGYSDTLARYLREAKGLQAEDLRALRHVASPG